MKPNKKNQLIEKKPRYREIVINNCYGGFELSALALKEYLKLKDKKVYFYTHAGDIAENKFKKISIAEADSKKTPIFYPLGEDIGNIIDGKLLNKCYIDTDILRDDPDLIKVVRRLGKKANGHFAFLKIVKIPINIKWQISEYDGMEWVAEQHRTWS